MGILNFGKKGRKMNIDYTDKYNSNEEDIHTEDVVEETVDEEEIDTDSSENEEEEEILMGVIYNTPKVYVRSGAGTDFEDIKVLDKGTEIFVNDETEDADGNTWYAVTLASGQDGFVMAKYVKIVG